VLALLASAPCGRSRARLLALLGCSPCSPCSAARPARPARLLALLALLGCSPCSSPRRSCSDCSPLRPARRSCSPCSSVMLGCSPLHPAVYWGSRARLLALLVASSVVLGVSDCSPLCPARRSCSPCSSLVTRLWCSGFERSVSTLYSHLLLLA
jgi:hypothetical protein